jgi:6-phosphogluconate dehydrogenase
MRIGVVGLGRMGANIVRRLMRGKHECVVYDRDRASVEGLAHEGAIAAQDLGDLVGKLGPQGAVWLMLPAGKPVEDTIAALSEKMAEGGVVIDGGNSFYRDDIRRAAALEPRGIHYVDVGTSGGLWGLERGYCLMIGGQRETVQKLDPIFACLAPGIGDIPRTAGRQGRDPRVEQGYIHCGPVGSGHFVKMIHNGIEYGLMQAYAEGFEILKARTEKSVAEAERYSIELADVAEVWRRGSVISSWLLDLTSMALAEDQALSQFTGVVGDSGEGRWTVAAAVETGVPATVLSAALYTRFLSQREGGYADRLLSAMRNKFGGHLEPPALPTT